MTHWPKATFEEKFNIFLTLSLSLWFVIAHFRFYLRAKAAYSVNDMTFKEELLLQIKDIINISDQIDTAEAEAKIKGNIWFKGPNVWILAVSIIIASVGLNVNSTAVIIGAMLISPLMGPITGAGLALGTNDIALMRTALMNLLIMIGISLLASCLYFLVSPLDLANPTELESRTSPTIYDVLIALFGGLAGILESCRKEKGTALAGVAIATALMPPLCTAGYGIAHANAHFFFGALFLFLINSVFIVLATYGMVRYFHFPRVKYLDPQTAKRTRLAMTFITLAVVLPSIISAVALVRTNNFTKNVQSFIASNKNLDNAYIYDYKIYSKDGNKAEVFFAGEPLTQQTKDRLMESAARHGIKDGQLTIKENVFGKGNDDSDKLLRGIYERADAEIAGKNSKIDALEQQIEDLKEAKIPYTQITKELRYTFPDVKEVAILKGAKVDMSLGSKDCMTIIAGTDEALPEEKVRKMEEWLRIRLSDTTVVVYNEKLK